MALRERDNDQPDELLTSAEVGRMFRVRHQAIVKWCNDGKLHAIRTPGGRRRFRASDVRRLLEEHTDERTPPTE